MITRQVYIFIGEPCTGKSILARLLDSNSHTHIFDDVSMYLLKYQDIEKYVCNCSFTVFVVNNELDKKELLKSIKKVQEKYLDVKFNVSILNFERIDLCVNKN